MNKIKKIALKIASFLALAIFLWPNFSALAIGNNFGVNVEQEKRSYNYKKISVDITVRDNASIAVEERLTYKFNGLYNKGWRSIPLNKIDDITDISVIDADTGRVFEESSKALDKTLSKNWSKFFQYKANGARNIEWYYTASDQEKTWIIRYVAHGAITFFKDLDEINWNIFTNYEVPVDETEVTVHLPDNSFVASQLQVSAYTNIGNGSSEVVDNKTFKFKFGPTPAIQSITVSAGWPKGLVFKTKYWLDFIKTNYFVLSSLGMFLVTMIVIFVYWYFTEKYRKGRGVIVAQYEPPRNFKPAMVELVVKERVSNLAWSATIIDLAVRGFIVIKEDESSGLYKKLAIIRFIVLILFLSGGSLFTLLTEPSWGALFFALPFWIFSIIFFLSSKSFMNDKDYILEGVKGVDQSNLEDYEKKFLKILFPNNNLFSTKEMNLDQDKQMEMSKKMKHLKEDLLKETDIDTGIFEKSLAEEESKRRKGIIRVITLIFLVILVDLFFYRKLPSQPLAILLVFSFCCALIYFFVKYEARLSAQGAILREEWLGFKLYLETAEKYRLQNLTPDLFEKYLPYAIIFGVEKKWGKAFDSFDMPAPLWYRSGVFTGGLRSSNASFSPFGFSSSFVSSFSSSFISSSGRGSSGGGGSAGGGGGGGGGGAS